MNHEDKLHDAYIRLQNIRSLIADQARAMRTGESSAAELDLLLSAEDKVRAEFEGIYTASRRQPARFA